VRRIIGCFAISGCVGVCFTSAVVLGQVGGAAPQPAPAHAQSKKAAAKVRAVGAEKKSPFDFDDPAVPAKGVAATVAAQELAIVKAVKVRAAMQPGQANRAPLIQQFTNQARPLLRAELIFARNVCQLNREELRKVNRDAQEMLDQVVAKLVDAQFQPRARIQVKGAMPAQNGVDPHQLLEDGVVSIMKKNLNAEQWSRYDAERQKRDDNRKRTTVRYFVDAIDRELYLTLGQCKQLETALKDNWDIAWTMYLENHLFGNKYYPITIDPLVTPLLTDAQRKVWGGVQKVGVYWGFAGMLAGFVNDPDGLEVELGEPARPGEQAIGPKRAVRLGVDEQGAFIYSKDVAGRAVAAPPKAKAESKKKAKRVVPDNVEKADKKVQ
jgi:hypothetical protein